MLAIGTELQRSVQNLVVIRLRLAVDDCPIGRVRAADIASPLPSGLNKTLLRRTPENDGPSLPSKTTIKLPAFSATYTKWLPVPAEYQRARPHEVVFRLVVSV